MRNALVRLVIVSFALCWMALSAAASEVKINRNDLPPAVARTVSEQSTGATVKSFSKEVEHGQTLYEAEMLVGDKSKDITMDQYGALLEVEEQVDLAQLNPSVRDGLLAAAGSGTIRKVESITKKGKLTAFEAQVRNHGKSSEVQVNPDGKRLTHAE